MGLPGIPVHDQLVVVLSVSVPIGLGIDPAQMSKIFDPYFTTKQNKSGTGLGLYITKKVIEDHNGSIKVDSVQGTGTTFVIRLPLLNN